MIRTTELTMKKIALLALVMATHSDALAMSWPELFQKYQPLFEQYPALEIIKRQQAAFARGEAPAIAHPDVRSIPIVENHESLVDVREIHNPRITMMPDPATPFESDACNSGLPSASKVRKTVYASVAAMIPNLDTLSPHFGYEPAEVSIKVFEGLRDLKTQEMLFNNKKAEIMAANMGMTDEQADAETSKWVSPVKNNVPVHSTGAAIDFRLWNEKKKEYLDLGKFGVIWGANPSVPTYSEDISDTQKRNRLYLQMAAALAGLTNYHNEYWHFSPSKPGAQDRYAAFWHEANADKRVAHYGSIE